MLDNRVVRWMRATALAAGLVVVPGQLLAQAQPARLPDSVTCVYDALAPEQRETIQVMMLEAESSGGDPIAQGMNSEEFDALLEDGRNACIDAFPWPAGKTDNATAYALLSLMMDGLHPIFEANSFAWADVDAYVAANRTRLRTNQPPSKAMFDALAAHLTAQGWTFDDDRRQAMEMYFSMGLLREQLRKDFAEGIFRYYER